MTPEQRIRIARARLRLREQQPRQPTPATPTGAPTEAQDETSFLGRLPLSPAPFKRPQDVGIEKVLGKMGVVAPYMTSEKPLSGIPAEIVETAARKAPALFGGGKEVTGELPAYAKLSIDAIQALTPFIPVFGQAAMLADMARDPVRTVKGLGLSTRDLVRVIGTASKFQPPPADILERLKAHPFTEALNLATPALIAAGAGVGAAKLIRKARAVPVKAGEAAPVGESAPQRIELPPEGKIASAEAGAPAVVPPFEPKAPPPPFVPKPAEPVAPQLKIGESFMGREGQTIPIKFRDGSLTIHDIKDTPNVGISNFGIVQKGVGTGSEMLKQTIDYIKQNFPNKEKIVLRPERGRNIRFYERFGFKRSGNMMELDIKKAEPLSPEVPKLKVEAQLEGLLEPLAAVQEKNVGRPVTEAERAALPPSVKMPVETMGGGLGFVKGGSELVESQKLRDAYELSKDRPKVSVIVSQPKKTPFSNVNRVPDVLRRLSPELGRKADDAFIWEIESRKAINQDNALADQAWKGLKPESQDRIRDVIEGKLKEEDLSPLERQRLPIAKQFNENIRQRVINDILRPQLLKGLTNPRRKIILEAANQPTSEAAAEFVRQAEFKAYGAKKAFSEELAQTAAEYRELADWGMDNWFHRLYSGELRMLVKTDKGLETIGFAKDVRDAQVKLDEFLEMRPEMKEGPLDLILFEKRNIPIELQSMIGKDAFKKWVDAVEGKGREIKIKTSRAGFFAAVGKLAKEGEISRDVAGEAVFQALYPRPYKRRIGSLKERKLEHELLGLENPEKTQRALSWSVNRKIFADKVRANFESELTKIQDPKTRRFVEDQIDQMLGQPTELDQMGREASQALHLPPQTAERIASGLSYYQSARLLGFTRQLRFALLNSTQKANIAIVYGEPMTVKGMIDAKASYKPGTWQNKLWNESGLAKIPTKFEGTELPIAKQIAGETGEIASEAMMFLVKHSELDNWRDTYFTARKAAIGKGRPPARANRIALLAVRDLQFPRTPTADVPILRGRLVSGTVGQFQSYNISQLNLYWKIFKGEPVSEAQITSPWGARARAFAYFWVTGGVRAMSSPLVGAALKWGVLSSTAIWIDNAYEALKKKFGEKVAQTVFFGVPGTVGIDVSQSVTPTVPFLSPGLAFTPPIASSIESAVKARNFEDFMRREAPQFFDMERDIKGHRLPELTHTEEVLKRFGFQPARVRGEQLSFEAKVIQEKGLLKNRRKVMDDYIDAREGRNVGKAAQIRRKAVADKLWDSMDDFVDSYKREKKMRELPYEKRRERSLPKVLR